MTPPAIDQVRGAVAYLALEKRERLARARYSLPVFVQHEQFAVDVLLAHAQSSVERADTESASADRVERGMLDSLCEFCDAEIAEDSCYGHDGECVICLKCVADE